MYFSILVIYIILILFFLNNLIFRFDCESPFSAYENKEEQYDLRSEC